MCIRDRNRVAREPEWPAQVGFGVGTHDDWVLHSHHGVSHSPGGGNRDSGGHVPSTPNREGREKGRPEMGELYSYGMAHLRTGEPHEAVKYFEKAISAMPRSNTVAAIHLFHQVGRAHDRMRNFSLAAQAYLKSRDLAEEIDDSEMMVVNKVAIEMACSRGGHEAGATGLIYIPSHFA
eukprot:TRINITY_DN49076_c0_g2_i1.p1 TRINITY_DN49076_c0_g2~~TRINITY_DN49076_c0_g2_i1.p1  ORF type:complete len:178 (-),score=43.12 TRINITY_DN49076_c0_g2_i1:470-1003(-)